MATQQPAGLPPSPVSSDSTILGSGDLPHPRAKPLRPGSNKEDLVRRFAEQQLMRVARRFVKKFSEPEPGDDVTGYRNFRQVCRDFEEVIDVLWKSGTPSLQIPFLLNIARELAEYAVAFPPSPPATFSVLSKLDHCFASLLCGRDLVTGEPLPGFENGHGSGGLTVTDMVRCKSLVEQTRILMATWLTKDAGHEDISDNDDTEADTDIGNSGVDEENDDDDDDQIFMDVARIYENTIDRLGQKLGDHVGAT